MSFSLVTALLVAAGIVSFGFIIQSSLPLQDIVLPPETGEKKIAIHQVSAIPNTTIKYWSFYYRLCHGASTC